MSPHDKNHTDFIYSAVCLHFSVTSSGTTLTLPDLGVSLTIPEGALDKGFTEEVFLAVMTEGRDRPRLSDNQTSSKVRKMFSKFKYDVVMEILSK